MPAPVAFVVRDARTAVGNNAYVLHNSLLGADGAPILQLMSGEIHVSSWASFSNFVDNFFEVGFRGGHETGFYVLSDKIGPQSWQGTGNPMFFLYQEENWQ